MRTQTSIILLSLAVTTGVAMGCGPDGEPTQRQAEAVDHAEVQQGITDHSQAAVDAIIDGLALLESAQMYDEYAGGGDCVGVPEDDGEFGEPSDGGDYECPSTAEPSEQLDDEFDAVADMLEERIFTEANVEVEEGDAVVYLLAGDVVCDEDDFQTPVSVVDPDGDEPESEDEYDEEAYQECVDGVDDLELRLKAAKYSGDTFEIDVMVGPDEVHPLTLVFSTSEVSATATLGAMEPAAEHIADVAGEDVGAFPDQLSGQLKAGYYLQGSEVRLAVDVLQDIDVEAGDFELFVQAAGEVFGVGVDTADEVFEAAVDFGEVSLAGEMPGGYEEPVDVTPPGEGSSDDEEPVDEPDDAEPVDIAVDLAGLSSTVIFDPASDEVQWSDVGIGNGPTTVAINGETVVDIQLDAGFGGVFDAVLAMSDDGLKYSVEPGIELEVGLMFERVVGEFDDVESWMLDEVLTIGLGGHANPAILVGEQLEVVRGHLSLTSQSGVGATAHAGQCLIDNQSTVEQMGIDAEDEMHPFAYIEAGQCSAE